MPKLEKALVKKTVQVAVTVLKTVRKEVAVNRLEITDGELQTIMASLGAYSSQAAADLRRALRGVGA